MSIQKRKRDLLKIAQQICSHAKISVAGSSLQISVFGPEGERKVYCAQTPSDNRDLKNVRLQIRRAAIAAGCNIPGRNQPTSN